MRIIYFLNIAFIVILMPCISYAGTAYYVDPSAGTNGNGAFTSPWNNISSVNNHSFNEGDDVYFKADTIYILNSNDNYLNIKWQGENAGDYAVIGCYWDDNGSPNHDCKTSGKTRPILNGGSQDPADTTCSGIGETPNCTGYPTNRYSGLIDIQNSSGDFVKIEYLNIRNSGGAGIYFGDTDYAIVQDNIVYNTCQSSITFLRVENGYIQNNYIEKGYNCRGTGACLQLTSAYVPNSCRYNTVRRNTVTECWEGIGIYKGPDNNIVEYNEVYDNRSYQIYVATGGAGNVVRNNIVYYTNTFSELPVNANDRAINISCESWECQKRTHSRCIKDVKVYNNFVTNTAQGILVSNHCDAAPFSYTIDDVKIYNNTIVDTTEIAINLKSLNGTGNEIKNNIIWRPGNDGNNTSGCNEGGVDWGYNLWDKSPGSGNCNSITDLPNAIPGLYKPSGWQNIAPGSLTVDEFKLQAGSVAIDAGTPLGSPYNSDYWGTQRPQGSAWDIGAHEYTGNGDTTPPAKPTGLIIVQ